MTGKRALMIAGKGLLWAAAYGCLFFISVLWGAKDAKLTRSLREAALVRAKAEGLHYAQILYRDDEANCPWMARCYSIGGMTSNGRYVVRTFWAKVNKRSA